MKKKDTNDKIKPINYILRQNFIQGFQNINLMKYYKTKRSTLFYDENRNCL